MTPPCIICGRDLESAMPGSDWNQPYAGTAFTSVGHYGSTVFDPMDGSFLEINVCDRCLLNHREAVLHGKRRPPSSAPAVYEEWEVE